MDLEKDRHSSNTELTLKSPDGFSIKTHCAALEFVTSTEGNTIACRLYLHVPYTLYREIDVQTLFNLKPEVRGPLTGNDFVPDSALHLKVTLQPDLLPQLLIYATSAEEAVDHLLKLSQQQLRNFPSISEPELATTQPKPESAKSLGQVPTEEIDTEAITNRSELHQPSNTLEAIDPLLLTESWLCLSVKQQQGDAETGFDTFWSYVSPTALQQATDSGEQISKGVADFFQEWVEADLSGVIQEATDEFIEEITRVFEGIAEDITATDLDFENAALFEIVVSFFESHDWPISQVEGETALQMAFQGENGQWSCYASTNEARQEFVFYSLCPINVPENQRLAMAEFLTRANYGITIGNFEMDFDNGEIHYKTSIDVEGDELSTALIQQLVAANVVIMNQYLPGIMAVIYGNVSPKEAIGQIENVS